MAPFEQLLLTVGLENVPYLQPKQLLNGGVCGLVHALKGVKIQLVETGDDDCATSNMDVSHASLLLEHSATAPFDLNRRDPDDLCNY